MQHTAKNRMDLEAIATVFAPNLLKKKDETPNSLMTESRSTTVVSII